MCRRELATVRRSGEQYLTSGQRRLGGVEGRGSCAECADWTQGQCTRGRWSTRPNKAVRRRCCIRRGIWCRLQRRTRCVKDGVLYGTREEGGCELEARASRSEPFYRRSGSLSMWTVRGQAASIRSSPLREEKKQLELKNAANAKSSRFEYEVAAWIV